MIRGVGVFSPQAQPKTIIKSFGIVPRHVLIIFGTA